MIEYSAVWTLADVRSYLEEFVATANADELIVAHEPRSWGPTSFGGAHGQRDAKSAAA